MSKGQRIVDRSVGQAIRFCLVSAISNTGVLRWMVLARAIAAPVLIAFLGRLIRDVPEKVFLIPHRRRIDPPAVRDWLAGRRDRIEMFLLPPHCPELNPDK